MKPAHILSVLGTVLALSACGGGGGGGGGSGAGSESQQQSLLPDLQISTVTAPNLPNKVVAGYYPNWTASPVRIKDIDPRYNVIYLFHAQPVGGSPGTTGAVYFYLPGDGRGAKTHFK
jgi:hypothetical protein